MGSTSRPDQPSTGLNSRKQRLGVTSIPERAIDREIAGLRSEDFQNLANHDGTMRSGRRFACGDHFRDIFRIAVRRVLLVLFGEVAGISAGITWTAFRLVR